MVLEDLQLLQAAGLTLLRTFDSSDEVSGRLLRLIKSQGLDFKVMLGVWIAPGQEAANQAEIERGVALATQHAGVVLAVSVGNERMVSWQTDKVPVTDMLRYIGAVRGRVSQPVTTDDSWLFWSTAPNSILEAVDFIAMHSYPLLDSVYDPAAWNWKQTAMPAAQRAAAMMDAALARSKADHAAVRAHLDARGHGNKPVVIGETGWKAAVSGGESERAHPVNQKMMFDRLTTWSQQVKDGTAGPKAIFWFEAFDEPWKGGDDKWGLFNVSRQARYVLQGRVANTAQTPWEPGSYSASDALYHVPLSAGGPVTANRYTAFAEAVTPAEARPSVATAWNAWENGTTAAAADLSAADSPDASTAVRITPSPASWGWGMALTVPTSAEDLTQFAAGKLHFSIRTTYPGKIEVGFLTGTASDASIYDVYRAIDASEYGYARDGQWHQVSIPVADLIQRGAPAFGMAGSVALDLTRVTNVFVIADRYGVTGKAEGSDIRTPIDIDLIYWTRN
jgi:exo-beta-1,3-glucanase (GH17 family)